VVKEDGMQPPAIQRSIDDEIRLTPAWREFIRFCRDMRHGEIDRLRIQDGVPVLAELTKTKIRFTRER
jgi:hypothetical protein